jgi:hypothetical protein
MLTFKPGDPNLLHVVFFPEYTVFQAYNSDLDPVGSEIALVG